MKKLVVFALLAFVFTGYAQEKREVSEEMKQRFVNKGKKSPEDIASMQTKELTLSLDLTEDQQGKVKSLLTEHYTERKAMMEQSGKKRKDMSKEELSEKRMAILDSQILLKGKMKEILNNEQYEKYSSIVDSKMKRANKKDITRPRIKHNSNDRISFTYL